MRTRSLFLATSLTIACAAPGVDSPPELRPPGAEAMLPGHRPAPGDIGRVVLQPVVDEEIGAQWRAYQDLDVTFSVPIAGRLRIELWSDGSAADNSGNALPVTVTPDGQVSFALRLGNEFVDGGSTRVVLGADRRLRLRLRRQESGGVLLYLDLRGNGGWEQQPRVFGVSNIGLYQGRRVVIVEQPAGVVIDLQIAPQAPRAALSFNRAFDRMSDWALYQRRPDGHADVPLSFAYRAPAPAMLVVDLLRSADGTELAGFRAQHFSVPAGDGRAARALLRGLPQGGNYDLRARLFTDSGALLGEDRVRDIAVGDVFLAIGQSNMSGFSPINPREEPAPEVHLFGNDYRWKKAQEPMDSGDDQVDRVSEEQPAHSLMLRFAKEVSRGAGLPIAVIPGPRYGTNIDDWGRRSERPMSRGSLYGSAVHRVLLHGYGAPIRGVLWFQGEGNAGSGIENYLNQLGRQVSDLRKDLGGRPFFANCQLATNGGHRSDAELADYLQVQEAQRRYVGLDDDSGLVALVDLPRDDPWHLNNFGIREAGRRLAMVTLAKSYGLRVSLGPQLLSATLAPGRRDAIDLIYDKPLRSGDAALFRARDGSGPLPISAASAAAERVTIQLRRVAQGAVALSYGYSSDPGAKWMVAVDGSGAPLAFQDLAVR